MLRFGVLGPLAVWDGDRPIQVNSTMLCRILALLLSTAGRPLEADRLADELWSGQPPRTARKTLQVYIHRLRRQLGEDRIVHGAAGYTLRADAQRIDAVAFDSKVSSAFEAKARGDLDSASSLLRGALELWRGAAYSGFRDMETVAAVAERLDQRRLSALEERFDTDLELGRHATLISELTTATAENPYRERICGQLMLALYRNGQQAEALQAYRAARELLVTDLGVEPVPELRHLHQRILLDDPGLAAPRSAPSTAGRCFLPRETPGFAGRDRELAELDSIAAADAATAGAVVISTVTGTAGVGKTALAVHWARRSADRYPDGQLYIDLHGYGPTPAVTTMEALRRLLIMLGSAAEQIPFDEQQAVAAYRAAVADRRMVILLDNAASTEQVRTLLPSSPGCMALVTSRDRLSGLIARDGARRLALEVLTVEGALDLLRAMLGTERVEAEPQGSAALAAACGYLPLALRIAAAKLVDQPHRGLADYALQMAKGDRLVELEVDDDSQSALRIVFNDSYRSLPDVERTAFRLLGIVHGSDISRPAVAALLGIEQREADAVVQHLLNAHLISEHVPGRYQMHDLLRDYARYLCGQSSADELNALTRLTDWYLDHADTAARLLDPKLFRMRDPQPSEVEFSSNQAAAQWLESERSNLVGIVVQASAHRITQASLLADALRAYLVFRSPLDLLTIADAAIPAADASGDRRAQFALRLCHAHGLSLIERLEEATVVALEAADLCEGSDWPAAELAVLGMLGLILFDRGDLDAAMKYGVRALEAATACGAVHVQAIALNRLATAALLRGRLPQAADYFGRAIVAHETAGEGVEQAVALLNLADVCRLLGDTGDAEELLNRSISLAGELNHEIIGAVARQGLALTLRAKGEHMAALSEAEKAYAVLTDCAIPQALVHAQQALASIRAEIGQTAAAEEMINEALPVAVTLGIKHPAVEIWITYADLLRRLGRIGEASTYASRALETAEACGYRLLEGEARTVLAEVGLLERAWDEAAAQALRAMRIQQETGHRAGEVHARSVLEAARARDAGPQMT